jgi:DNA-binding protein Fis
VASPVPDADAVAAALEAAGGNVSQAWKDLGLRNRDQLRRLLRRYDL